MGKLAWLLSVGHSRGPSWGLTILSRNSAGSHQQKAGPQQGKARLAILLITIVILSSL